VNAPVTRSGREATASLDQVRDWCEVAARAAWAKGGEDSVILMVGEVLPITDAFVITSGSNPRQVRTIVEEVEEQVKRAGGPAPRRIEGLDDARWVLMDYGDFVVHVLLHEARHFYRLERLWADAKVWPWSVDRGEWPADQGDQRVSAGGA
jgi:ribosome-associated protein